MSEYYTDEDSGMSLGALYAKVDRLERRVAELESAFLADRPDGAPEDGQEGGERG